jgi:subtilisin
MTKQVARRVDPGRTGRLLVAYPPRSWRQLRPHFAAAGVGDAAHLRDFTSEHHRFRDAPAGVIDDLGVAVIDPARVDATLWSLARIPGATVRHERVLTRASTVAHGAAAPPTELDWIAAGQSWALAALGVRAGDDEGAGVRVAVVDTGVTAHPDLAGRVVGRMSLVPGGDDDAVGHGTHCAGLIAGRRVPQRGPRYGVAPRAELISIRVFASGDDAPEATVRAALYLAARARCRVISLAAGRLAPTYAPEDAALGAFLRAEGCLLMAAAGNDSDRGNGELWPTRAPANAPHVPAIGALTPAARVWNNSNGVGDDAATRVDALAPGTMIASAWKSGGTQVVSGTSAATAIAAGAAAAVWSRARAQTVDEVLDRLLRAARPLPAAAPGSAGAGYLQLR